MRGMIIDESQTSELPVVKETSESSYSRFGSYVSKLAVGVLRLRRVQVALTTILVSLLIMGFPQLQDLGDDLLMLMAAILMVALGGYSMGDALQNGQADSEMDVTLDEIVDDLGIQLAQRDEAIEEVVDVRREEAR